VSSTGAIAEFFSSHFRGTAPLDSAFWGVGVAGGVVSSLIALALAVVGERLRLPILDGGVPLMLAFGYAGFSHVCMWRCSRNTDSAFFSRFVRFLVQGNAAAVVICLVILLSVLVLRVIG
jgi:hypothetical protein